jgi:hypothetical protein
MHKAQNIYSSIVDESASGATIRQTERIIEKTRDILEKYLDNDQVISINSLFPFDNDFPQENVELVKRQVRYYTGPYETAENMKEITELILFEFKAYYLARSIKELQWRKK